MKYSAFIILVLLYVYSGDTVFAQKMQGIFDEALEYKENTKVQQEITVIDDFDKSSTINLLNGRTNVYQMAPSRVMMSSRKDEREGESTNVLTLKFKRMGDGGPYGKGGWCGYYSAIKKVSKSGTKYFNAANYEYLTLWVKGEKGGENFIVGMADKHWDKAGDTVKSNQIINYLPEKRITQEWQKARIPLADFLLNLGEIASIAVSFERDCFPEGIGKGLVYIDDISFE